MQTLPIKSSLSPKDIEITEQLLGTVNNLLKHFYSMPRSPGLRQCVNALVFTRTLIKRCSKCGTFSKLVQSFPPLKMDAWCDECLVSTPLIERTRKCSIGQRWLLFQKQEAEGKKRADLLTQAQAEKKALADKRAKDKKASSTKSKKKTVENAYSLALDFGESTVNAEEEEACNAILAHYARRARIEKTEDKTIFDNDYYGECDN